MSKKKRAARVSVDQRDVASIIERYRDLLGIGHYRIELDMQPDLPDNIVAQVRMMASQPSAKLLFGGDLPGKHTLYFDLEETIVHELVHIVLHPLEIAYGQATYYVKPKSLRRQLEYDIQRNLERTTETIARAIVAAARHGNDPYAEPSRIGTVIDITRRERSDDGVPF